MNLKRSNSSVQISTFLLNRKPVTDAYQVEFRLNSFVFLIDRLCSGLTFAEETNLKILEQYHDFLREKCSQLDENASTKYTNKGKRTEMQNVFERKLLELDREREERLTLRNRLRLYHLAWRTIKKYIEEEQTLTTNATESRLLEDVVIKSIFESMNLFPKSIDFCSTTKSSEVCRRR